MALYNLYISKPKFIKNTDPILKTHHLSAHFVLVFIFFPSDCKLFINMKYQLLKFEGDHINHSVNLFLLHPPPPSPFFLSRASLKRLES